MESELYYFLAALVVAGGAVGLITRRNSQKALKAPPKPAELQGPARRRRERALPEPARPEPAAPAKVEAEKPAPRRPRDTSILREGLAKTRGGFIAKIGELFAGKKEVDAATLDKLEEVLLSADIGVKTSQKIFASVRDQLSKEQLTDPQAIWNQIRAESTAVLDVGAAPIDFERARPFVLLVVGVNGVGKTTTIGKLAAKYTAAGKKVLLAAGDTFRAAATEQLEIWGQRTGCPVVRGKDGSDPSSVIFDGVKRAQAEGYDILIADTAGRLHTKSNLMEELDKVRRVTNKAMPGAPHETILVLDSTNGQNAIHQAQMFKEVIGLTGIVLTKLDGTAKGGVILGICDELQVPVRYIGIGEKVEDLRDFDPEEFVAALYEDADQPAAA